MAISDRVSSGGVVTGIGECVLRFGKSEAGYSRKHLPDEVRPARPARWFADASEQGVTDSTSITVRGLNVLIYGSVSFCPATLRYWRRV